MEPVARRLLAAVAVAGLLLAGCATVPPSPSASISLPPATPTAAATSATPNTPGMASPATPTASPSAETALVLAGNGLAGQKFGAPEETVEAIVRQRLGEPDEVTEAQACELDTGSPWSRTLSYDGLWVQFLATSTSKSAPRTLQAWGFMLAREFAPPLEMADGVPLNLTFAQLKAKYPKGKLTSEPLGEEPVKIFTLPSKVRFIGYERRPDMVSAGVITFCE